MTTINGQRYEGEWKDGDTWNLKIYSTYVNTVHIELKKEFHSLSNEFEVLKVELQQALKFIQKSRGIGTQKD